MAIRRGLRVGEDHGHAAVERFLRALHRGGQDYHGAFSGPNDERRDGPTAPDIKALLAKSSGQSIEQIKLSISYIDPNGRLNIQDVARQSVGITRKAC